MPDDVGKAAENSAVYVGMMLELQPTGGSCRCLGNKAGELDSSGDWLQPSTLGVRGPSVRPGIGNSGLASLNSLNDKTPRSLSWANFITAIL